MQPTIEIANMGMWDTLIIGVLALVVFGPRRLPEIGRQIGKLMYEVRKASNDFKFQMEEELRKSEESDRRAKEEERLRALAQSQVPNAGPGAAAAQLPDAEAGAAAAVPDGQFPTPSPYPGESAADEPPGRMAAPLELEASESQLSESSLGAPAEPESAGPTFRSYNTPESGAAEIPVGDTTPSSEQAHHG